MQDFNRNKSRIEILNGTKIVSKEHQELTFLKREEYFYNLFGKNQIIKTPKIYKIQKLNIKTRFIEGKEKNVYLAMEDWARVHSYFIKNPLKENRLFMHHDINKISRYLLQYGDIFNSFGKSVENRFKGIGLNSEIKTLLHGDLTSKNFISFKNENYYFDFELGGIGHPARDIASMIISNPSHKTDLLNSYKNYFKYDYPNIREDIENWTFVRASQLYFILDKRKGDKKQKDKIKNKLVNIIEELI